MLRLEARTRTPAWYNLVLPFVAVAMTLVLASGLIALAGANVLQAYGVLFVAAFGGTYAITETLVRAAPMIFTGLAVAVAFRAKFWNIGAEGQLLAGAVASCAVGELSMPGPLAMLLMAFAGMAAGAFVAFGFGSRSTTSCRRCSSTRSPFMH
jgi:simple sugar transport system permease protein